MFQKNGSHQYNYYVNIFNFFKKIYEFQFQLVFIYSAMLIKATQENAYYENAYILI